MVLAYLGSSSVKEGEKGKLLDKASKQQSTTISAKISQQYRSLQCLISQHQTALTSSVTCCMQNSWAYQISALVSSCTTSCTVLLIMQYKYQPNQSRLSCDTLYNRHKLAYDVTFIQHIMTFLDLSVIVYHLQVVDISPHILQIHNQSKSFNCVLKQLNNWKQCAVDAMVLTLFHLAQLHFAEIHRGCRGLGNYNLRDGVQQLPLAMFTATAITATDDIVQNIHNGHMTPTPTPLLSHATIPSPANSPMLSAYGPTIAASGAVACVVPDASASRTVSHWDIMLCTSRVTLRENGDRSIFTSLWNGCQRQIYESKN